MASGLSSFGPGDRIPDFRLPDTTGAARQFYVALAGGPIILAVLSDPGQAEQRAFLGEMGAWADALGEAAAEVFAICGGAAPPPAIPGITVLRDPRGQVCAHLLNAGAAGRPIIDSHRTYVLDPNQRVLAVVPPAEASIHLDRVGTAIDAWRVAEGSSRVLNSGAPVLLLPQVFDQRLCAELIERWHDLGHVEGGNAGAYGDEIRQDKKRTRDHIITDEALHDRICEILMRRITPEITKVFRDDSEGYYFDRHVIISYAADRDDFFGAHRDNFTAETQKRTYAVSLNLNDDYEGGELRFPEYGPHRYKPLAGAACVFSCSLLHEALPVTEGQRWALTTFLWR